MPPEVRRSQTLSHGDVQRILNFLILADQKYRDYERSLNQILAHFDLVAFCTEQDLCNSDIVHAFYCGEYRTLRPVFTVSLVYYGTEGIMTGTHSKRYFHENCRALRPESIGGGRP